MVHYKESENRLTPIERHNQVTREDENRKMQYWQQKLRTEDKFQVYSNNFLIMMEKLESIGDDLLGQLSIAKKLIELWPGQKKRALCPKYNRAKHTRTWKVRSWQNAGNEGNWTGRK